MYELIVHQANGIIVRYPKLSFTLCLSLAKQHYKNSVDDEELKIISVHIKSKFKEDVNDGS